MEVEAEPQGDQPAAATGAKTITIEDAGTDSAIDEKGTATHSTTSSEDNVDEKEVPMEVDQEGFNDTEDSSSTVSSKESAKRNEVTMMEVEQRFNSSTDTDDSSSIDNEDNTDVIEMEKLGGLLSQGEKASKEVEGKDVMLPLGCTGAGKTTTILYLLGATFEETEVGGKDHYVPNGGVEQEVIDEFRVSGSATSVTKTIHAIPTKLRNGEVITMCDTPGFGDTKGVEMEISNGLGIIAALRKARSVRPVLVFDFEGLSTARFAQLRNTLKIVIAMMGKHPSFSSFEYVFTRCDQKRSKKVHKQLIHFQKSRNEDPDQNKNDGDEAILDALLSDMIEKTTPQANYIEVDEIEDAPGILENLWSSRGPRIDNPATAFVDFLSRESSDKLKLQISRMARRMEKTLKKKDLASFEGSLQKLVRFSELLSFPEINRAVEEGRKMGRDFICELAAEASTLTERAITAEKTEDFKKAIQVLSQVLDSFCLSRSICVACQVPTEEYSSVLQSCSENLFGAIHGDLVKVQDDPGVSGWHQHLKRAVTRTNHVSKALKPLVGSDQLQVMSSPTAKVATELLKHRLGMVEEILGTPTAEGLAQARDDMISLLHVKGFFLDSDKTINFDGVNNESWKWFGQRVTVIVEELTGLGHACMSKLREHTLKDDFEESGWCQAVEALSVDDAVVESRAFLLELCSSRLKAIMEKDTEEMDDAEDGENDPTSVVATFDECLGKAFAPFVTHADGWTKEKQSSSQKSKAEKLLKTVNAACLVCHKYRLSNPSSLDQVKTELTGTKALLEAMIKKWNSMPSRPDDLPYGPEELGKPFHCMILQLRAFKVIHGHCNVAQRDPKYEKLGRWVSTQRKAARQREQGKKTSLTDERIEALQSLGFEWEVQAKENKALWDLRFAELVKFKEEHGHCNVPYRYAPNKKLGNWVNSLRRERKKGKVTKEKIKQVDSIGFAWCGK